MRDVAVLRDLDLETSPEADLRGAHAVAAPLAWTFVEGDEPAPFEEWCADERRRATNVEVRHVVAIRDDAVVGHAFVELDREDNTHLAWTQLAVAPTHRRQGIGTQLVRRLIEVAVEEGRTSWGVVADQGSAGGAFAAGLGLTARQVVHLNRLRTADLDPGLLQSWIDRAADRAGGYHLEVWDGPTPPERVEAFAACNEIMNTAPLGDLEVEDERMTPDRLRKMEAARLASGMQWWTLVAVEDATGAFAGFTQLSFSGWRSTIAKQHDTGVDPAHRDRGLGRWLKAANLQRLLAERPDVVKIDTGNAGSNAPMLGINHALGFRLARESVNWQGDVAVARKLLDERAAAVPTHLEVQS